MDLHEAQVIAAACLVLERRAKHRNAHSGFWNAPPAIMQAVRRLYPEVGLVETFQRATRLAPHVQP
jgi:hypothetical protein